MCLCLVPTFGVSADENVNGGYVAPDASNAENKDDCFGDSGMPTGKGFRDENGHITVGLWNCYTGDYYNTVYDLTFWTTHKYASYLFVQRKGSINDYKYTLMSVDEDGNVVGSWVYGQGTMISTLTPGSGSEWSKRQCSTPYTLFRPASSEGTFSTNMPIYDADSSGYDEAVQKYIKNGDVSGAENSTDIAREDNSIEIPRNLTLSGGYAQRLNAAYSIDKDIVLNWNQTVDTSAYAYTVEAQVTMDMKSSNFGASHNTGEYYSSDWIEFKRANYEGAQQVGLTLSHNELDTKLIESFFNNYVAKTGKKVPYKGYSVAKIKVRVRNYLEGKASNYVVISIDKESVTNTATVEDENGDTVEDENNADYDGNTDITNKQDSQDFDLSGLADVLDLIRNGFGLFGSNGLIAMFSKFFSYLPSKYWSLILLGVGLMVFVGIVNFLLKR